MPGCVVELNQRFLPFLPEGSSWGNVRCWSIGSRPHCGINRLVIRRQLPLQCLHHPRHVGWGLRRVAMVTHAVDLRNVIVSGTLHHTLPTRTALL